MQTIVRSMFLPAYLLVAILLGGASNGGFAANLMLQLLGILLLAWAFVFVPRRGIQSQSRALWWIAGLGLAIAVFQFVPLPLDVWKSFPERDELLQSARNAGIETGPVFVSLMPHESLKSAVWLVPAAAMLFGLLRTKPIDPRPFAWALQLGTVLSVLAGALQLAGGFESGWYFYDITNRGSTVGFFANSNHLTTLLLLSLPFLAALTRSAPNGPRRSLVMALAGGSFTVVVIGIVVNGSLSGYGLVLPVLAGSALILVKRTSIRQFSAALLLPAVIVGLLIVLLTEDGYTALVDSTALSANGRDVIFANTWSAIRDFMPMGTGIGSFAEIYRLYEAPAEVTRSYINHAHNDYLELLLETGAAGALLLVVFLGWWLMAAIRIWHARDFDAFAGAAVVASAAVLVHSLVDYPLRTAAIGCIFAMCCGLMDRRAWAGKTGPDNPDRFQ